MSTPRRCPVQIAGLIDNYAQRAIPVYSSGKGIQDGLVPDELISQIMPAFADPPTAVPYRSPEGSRARVGENCVGPTRERMQHLLLTAGEFEDHA